MENECSKGREMLKVDVEYVNKLIHKEKNDITIQSVGLFLDYYAACM